MAEREGLTAESPRRALVAGYKLGLIEDEALWLEMMSDRNLTSHIYHHKVAERIFANVTAQYVEALSTTLRSVRAVLAAS